MTGLNKLIKQYKTATSLAEKLGVTSQAINQWKSRGVPAEWVPKLVKASKRGEKITPYEFRPDIYHKKDKAA